MPLSDDERAQFRKLIGGGGGDSPSMSTSEPSSDEAPSSGTGQFAKGYAQGWLNLVEGPAQWAEQGIRHATGSKDFKLPLHDWAAGFRRSAESTLPGIAGEVAGVVSPFAIPFGSVAESIRGPALASDLARISAAAARLPGAARAAGLAERVAASPGAAGLKAGWRSLDAGQRAAAKGAAAGTFLTPKDSDKFGEEAIKDAFVGGALGKLGNIGERLWPGGPAVEDLYRSGEIPPVFKKRPMGGYRPPKTRPPTEATEAARTESALKEARRLREELETPGGPGRATFARNYPEEMRLASETFGQRAARRLERERAAADRRRDLPRWMSHLGWHLPFLFGHSMGLPMPARYFGASLLSMLARQWGRHLARGRMGRANPLGGIEDELERAGMSPYRSIRARTDQYSPAALGAAGATVRQNTPDIYPFYDAEGDHDAY